MDNAELLDCIEVMLKDRASPSFVCDEWSDEYNDGAYCDMLVMPQKGDLIAFDGKGGWPEMIKGEYEVLAVKHFITGGSEGGDHKTTTVYLKRISRLA